MTLSATEVSYGDTLDVVLRCHSNTTASFRSIVTMTHPDRPEDVHTYEIAPTLGATSPAGAYEISIPIPFWWGPADIALDSECARSVPPSGDGCDDTSDCAESFLDPLPTEFVTINPPANGSPWDAWKPLLSAYPLDPPADTGESFPGGPTLQLYEPGDSESPPYFAVDAKLGDRLTVGAACSPQANLTEARIVFSRVTDSGDLDRIEQDRQDGVLDDRPWLVEIPATASEPVEGSVEIIGDIEFNEATFGATQSYDADFLVTAVCSDTGGSIDPRMIANLTDEDRDAYETAFSVRISPG